jgi:hypothetical protein
MSTAPRILTPAQVDEFMDRGYVVLRHAFSSVVATRIRTAIWQKLGLDPNDKSGWTKPLVHIQECFWGAPFSGCVTGRFKGAIDDLLGAGRWKPMEHMGWWPVAFPGFEKAEDTENVAEWHVDGGHFHHHLTGPDQGLLPLFLFSDVGPEDGGTLLVEGSHLAIARALHQAEPKGLSMSELMDVAKRMPKPRVTRVIGRAGDIVLVHPLVVHARSPNMGQRVRFIANPCVTMRAPLKVTGDDLSPVERAIARGIAARPMTAVGAA